MKHAQQTIQSSGLAATWQRELILKCIQNRKDHPDAETIHQGVKQTMPSISLDTVYRTLGLFAGKGIIQQLAAPTHSFRYDGCVAPHDHFICTRCERIVDISIPDSGARTIPEEVKMCGSVQFSQRTYLGICQSCAQPEAVRAAR